MSELDNAKARSEIFEYLQLKAKMDYLEAEGAVIKTRLEMLMKVMGVTEVTSQDGRAQILVKHKYEFDIPKIVAAVPEITPKLKLSNEDFNRVLVGREAQIGPFRRVVGSTESLVISAPRKK